MELNAPAAFKSPLGTYGTIRAISMTVKPFLELYLSTERSRLLLEIIFRALLRKKNLSKTKLIVTPTVSAMTDKIIPGTIPKISVFAVEKIIAGGKPIALTKSVSRKLNTTANDP